MNVTASNVARLVSVNGELDNSKSKNLYDVASKQLGNRIEKDSLSIELETNTANTTYVPAQKVIIKNGTYPAYKVNLGDDFTVHLKAKITLFHVAGKSITTTMSSSSSGVGEVYFKSTSWEDK